MHSTLLDRFYAAATQRDATALRALLTDDFTFTSPMGTFDTPEAYVAHLVGFAGYVTERRTITEGARVVHLSVYNLQAEDETVLATIPLCDIFTVRDGRFAAQETFCDTALFPVPA